MYSYNEIPLGSLNIYRDALNEVGIIIDKEKFYTFNEVKEFYSKIKYHQNLLNSNPDLLKAFNRIERTIELYSKTYWELKYNFCFRLTESWGFSELPGEKDIVILEDGTCYITYTHDRSFVNDNKDSKFYYYPSYFRKELEPLNGEQTCMLYDFILENKLLEAKTSVATCDWSATLSIVYKEKCNRFFLDHKEYKKYLKFLENLLSFNDDTVYEEMKFYHFKRGRDMAEYYSLLHEDLKKEGFFDEDI